MKLSPGSLCTNQVSNFSKNETLLPCVCYISLLGFFWCNSSKSDLTSQYITPEWEIFSWAFVKMWSIKVEVLLVILVGRSVNWVRRYIEQNSLYLFISGSKFLSSILISFGLLRTYLSWRVSSKYFCVHASSFKC